MTFRVLSRLFPVRLRRTISKTVKSLEGTKVNQVIIGSCTNSSFTDLMMVAKVLKGQTIHPAVEFAIAPGSRQVLNMLAANGALADIVAAGARILETACGPCIGLGFSPADGTVSVRTFNRNFAGRTGTKNDNVFLTSPEVAVIAALKGEIIDPRKAGIEYPKIELPEKFLIDDNMIQKPLPPQEGEKSKSPARLDNRCSRSGGEAAGQSAGQSAFKMRR